MSKKQVSKKTRTGKKKPAKRKPGQTPRTVCPVCLEKKSRKAKLCRACHTANGGAGGRKLTVWSEDQWKAFASMCLLTERRHRVAAAMGPDVKTIDGMVNRRMGCSFSEYIQKRFREGNFKILGKQYEVAMSGDRTMLIWLGKNRLSQSDKIDTKDTTPTLPPGAIVIEPETLEGLPDNVLRHLRNVLAAKTKRDDD
jgi:hypothetical protein